MLLTHPLEVVTPTVDGDVLQVLSGAQASFTVGQLHQFIDNHSYNGIRKALLRLVSQGIVSNEQIGSAQVYHLNRDHLAAPAIIELAQLRTRFLDRLRETFGGWASPPAFAVLFGSAARTDMQVASDIDIFIVRPQSLDSAAKGKAQAWAQDCSQLQTDATAWTGNDTRILEMSEDEVRAGISSADPLLVAIREEGLILVDTSGFWRRMSRG